MQDMDERFQLPDKSEGLPITFTVYVDDDLFARQTVHVDPLHFGPQVQDVIRHAFNAFQTATAVHVHRGLDANGCFLAAQDRDRMIRWFTPWWDDARRVVNHTHEASLVDRYKTTRSLARLWDDAMVEVAAYGRLRAALRSLGGDL